MFERLDAHAIVSGIYISFALTGKDVLPSRVPGVEPISVGGVSLTAVLMHIGTRTHCTHRCGVFGGIDGSRMHTGGRTLQLSYRLSDHPGDCAHAYRGVGLLRCLKSMEASRHVAGCARNPSKPNVYVNVDLGDDLPLTCVDVLLRVSDGVFAS